MRVPPKQMAFGSHCRQVFPSRLYLFGGHSWQMALEPDSSFSSPGTHCLSETERVIGVRTVLDAVNTRVNVWPGSPVSCSWSNRMAPQEGDLTVLPRSFADAGSADVTVMVVADEFSVSTVLLYL
jgi:hypothetical protein